MCYIQMAFSPGKFKRFMFVRAAIQANENPDAVMCVLSVTILSSRIVPVLFNFALRGSHSRT